MTTYDEHGHELPDESGELPPDDDGDGGEQEGQDESKAGPTTPAPPPPEAEGRSARSHRKKGRIKAGKPGEKRRGPPRVREAFGAAAVAEMNAEGAHPPPGARLETRETVRETVRAIGKIDPRQEATGDILERWPLVLEMLQQEGLGPDAVVLRVTAMPDGPYATAPAYLGPVDGRSVVGGGDVSPVDALAVYIEQVYHSAMRGPMRYQIDVHYKVSPLHRPRGATHICRGYISLQPYDVIIARRRREEDYLRHQSATAGSRPAPGLGAGVGAIPLGGLPGAGAAPAAAAAPGVPYYPQPAGPSFSEELVRDIVGRIMRGEPIGPQPAPVVFSPPAPAPTNYTIPPEPPPPPPSFKEQLKDFAEMMKIMQGMTPAPAPVAVQAAAAPTVGVGRAVREEAPQSPLEQVQGAFSIVREFRKLLRDELVVDSSDGEEDEEKPEKEEAPFKVIELPGGYKWPHGKGLSRVDQFQNFMMLNPDFTVKVGQGLSGILDRSIVRQLLEFIAQRGNPQQVAAAQQAMQQGLGGPGLGAPPQVPQPALPPVVRPPPNGTAHPPMPPPPPLARKFTPVV